MTTSLLVRRGRSEPRPGLFLNVVRIGLRTWVPGLNLGSRTWVLDPDLNFLLLEACDSGKFIALPASQGERLAWMEELLDKVDFQAQNEAECYLLVTDYDFPAKFHDQLDWAPPARMKITRDMLGDHSLRIAEANKCDVAGSEKLVPFLGLHVEEEVDAKRLKFMIQVMNARVHKIHAAIKFRCSKALAPWMQWCYDERIRLKKTGQPIEAEAIKLAMNSIYGKLIQNVETYRSAGVHTNIQS